MVDADLWTSEERSPRRMWTSCSALVPLGAPSVAGGAPSGSRPAGRAPAAAGRVQERQEAYRRRVDVRRLGRVPYVEALDLQQRLHAQRVAGEVDDVLLLLEHDPVFTTGRRTRPEDLPTRDPAVLGAPVVDVDRGGRVTWHGPGQVVAYAVVRLPLLTQADGTTAPDVVGHVRRLERALVATCADLGLAARVVEGRSGVWVDDLSDGPQRKVAAVGVHVARGVTTHGVALNVDCDLTWATRVVPCGIADAGVTSLSVELGRPVALAHALDVAERRLVEALEAGTELGPGTPHERQITEPAVVT